jgi:hypothetical protein
LPLDAPELMPSRLVVQRAAALLELFGDALLVLYGLVAAKLELGLHVGDGHAHAAN